MGSDYCLVLGILLLCSPKTALLGIGCILAAIYLKRKKPRRRRKLDQINFE